MLDGEKRLLDCKLIFRFSCLIKILLQIFYAYAFL